MTLEYTIIDIPSGGLLEERVHETLIKHPVERLTAGMERAILQIKKQSEGTQFTCFTSTKTRCRASYPFLHMYSSMGTRIEQCEHGYIAVRGHTCREYEDT